MLNPVRVPTSPPLPALSQYKSWVSVSLSWTEDRMMAGKCCYPSINTVFTAWRPRILFKFNATLKMRSAVAVCLRHTPQSPKSSRGGGRGGLWVGQHVCFTVISLLCGPALPSPAERYTHACVTSPSWVGESQASWWWLLGWQSAGRGSGSVAVVETEAREIREFSGSRQVKQSSHGQTGVLCQRS